MTQPVDSQSRRSLEDLFANTTNDPAATAAAGASPATTPATGEFEVDSLPMLSRDLGAFARNAMPTSPPIAVADTTTPTVKPRTAVQVALDERMAAYSGPYNVGGQQVSVPAQFRMNHGLNDVAAGMKTMDPRNRWERAQINHSAELEKIGASVGVDAGVFKYGCPTGTQLVKVTQALIDAGKLPPAKDVQTAIKKMQFDWGVGIDCTNYVVPAAVSALHAHVDVTPGSDYFTNKNPDTNPSLKKVSPSSVQPGDVFCLSNPNPQQVGHRAVVYSRTEADDASKTDLIQKYGPAAADFLRDGKVQVFEVDSSFGAGEAGSPLGGVRRDTWFFNETLNKWGQLTPIGNGASIFSVSPPDVRGPYGENLKGIYRFRVGQ